MSHSYVKKSYNNQDKWRHSNNDPVFRKTGSLGRVFANDAGYLCSIPGRVIPKTKKMVLDTCLRNTQEYKVCIKGKVEQSRERSSP